MLLIKVTYKQQIPYKQKSHGRRSVVDYSPWGRKELDMTERLYFHFHHQTSLFWIFLPLWCFEGIPSICNAQEKKAVEILSHESRRENL